MTSAQPTTPDPRAAAYGLSDEYWGRLTPEERDLYDVVRPLRSAAYKVDFFLSGLERQLQELSDQAQTMGGVFELIPDFQRGHVWDQPKQIAFMENMMRGSAPATIKFNSPGRPDKAADIHPYTMVCVDGLQRLTAMRAFMKDEFAVLGRRASEWADTPFDPRRLRWSLECFDFGSRAEVLQFYLDLNTGGVVHTQDELDRVRTLHAQAVGKPQSSTKMNKQAKR